jgi:predicted RND superfamily exporter protein
MIYMPNTTELKVSAKKLAEEKKRISEEIKSAVNSVLGDGVVSFVIVNIRDDDKVDFDLSGKL